MQTHGGVRDGHLEKAYRMCPIISQPDPLSSTSGKWETNHEAFYQPIFNFLSLSQQQEERAK